VKDGVLESKVVVLGGGGEGERRFLAIFVVEVVGWWLDGGRAAERLIDYVFRG